MSGDATSKRKSRKFLRPIVLLAIFAIIIFFVISLIRTPSWFTNIFSLRTQEITVSEFNFEAGRSRAFAKMDNSIAAAGTLGIMVFDFEGRETLRDSFRMSQPAIISSGNRCIAFDIGGTAVRVFDGTNVISSIEADGVVVSASINQNGWFCTVTQDVGGARSIVTVYNSTGAVVYFVRMGTGFVLSAELSPDNKSLAILNFSETGSRVNFYYDIGSDRDEPDHVFDLYGGLIIDIAYLSSGNVLAVSTDSVFLVDSLGDGEMLYSFTGYRLGGFTQDNDFIALHLLDYGIGHQGRLVTLLTDGTVLGEIAFDREILSMSSFHKSLVVLKNDDVTFFNEELKEFRALTDNFSAAGASSVLAIREDTVLAASDNFAIVVMRDEE